MYNITDIQKILPHRYPFILIDRITSIEKQNSIEGYKNISISDPIFQGHFPDYPIYPGVMIIEGMAQVGGLLAFQSLKDKIDNQILDKVVYFISIDKAKFRIPVTPGDQLIYKLTCTKNRGNVWQFIGKSYVKDKLVAEAELKAMIVDK